MQLVGARRDFISNLSGKDMFLNRITIFFIDVLMVTGSTSRPREARKEAVVPDLRRGSLTAPPPLPTQFRNASTTFPRNRARRSRARRLAPRHAVTTEYRSPADWPVNTRWPPSRRGTAGAMSKICCQGGLTHDLNVL